MSPLNEATEPEPVEEDGARQVAALLYTSGTTGNLDALPTSSTGKILKHRLEA